MKIQSPICVCQVLMLIVLLRYSPVCADEPVDRLPKVWQAILEAETSSETRMARIAGYLEGAYDIKIPKWWRKNGFTAMSQRRTEFPNDGSLQYGVRATDKLVSNAGVFTACANNDENAIEVTRKAADGMVMWSRKIVLHFGIEVTGYSAIDCGITESPEQLIIFGRNGEVRFVMILGIQTGAVIGKFAFLESEVKEDSPKPPSEK